MYKEAVVTKLR